VRQHRNQEEASDGLREESFGEKMYNSGGKSGNVPAGELERSDQERALIPSRGDSSSHLHWGCVNKHHACPREGGGRVAGLRGKKQRVRKKGMLQSNSSKRLK